MLVPSDFYVSVNVKDTALVMTRSYSGMQKVLLRLFLACVVPTASSACEVWDLRSSPGESHFFTADTLINTYFSMLRQFANVSQTVAAPILLEELAVQPLRRIWQKRGLTFWNSLVGLPGHHLFTRTSLV